MAQVVLHGWRHSLYTQAAQVILAEKGTAFRLAKVNPFDNPAAAITAGHPFARIPVLDHGGFRLFESAAIGTYVDAAFLGPPLTPTDAKARARMVQAISLFDAYGFRPMILDHYANAVFAGLEGRKGDRHRARAGLMDARPVLAALERIAAEGLALAGPVTLADCHLGPMLRAFAASADGAALLAEYPALNGRRQMLESRPSLAAAGLP